MKILSTLTLAALLAAAIALPADARFVGVASGQRAFVANSIAGTQQRNNAAIAHVQRSIAATRRRQF